MKRNRNSLAGTKLQVEVRLPGLVRVNSHIRIQHGKPVKVRSYYRDSRKVEMVTVRVSTR